MKDLAKVESIYHSALERPPHEREDFVRKSCGDDEELRREVESLLSFDEKAGDFIEKPPEDIAADLFTNHTQTNPVGKELNHYLILAEIGKGGMGEVYLAKDTKLGRKVALKLLPPQFSEDADRRQRFEKEARAVSALNHPNIITIFGIEETENLNFIATEFIEGETLREKIAAQTFSPQETVEIGIQIASALESAHSVGIIHRDIKPANVMMRRDGIVKVLDFGLAKLVESGNEKGSKGEREWGSEGETEITSTQSPHLLISPSPLLTKAGAIMGTLNYMSPEQAKGEPLDARTDIFSLGVVMYEMLSGIQPFAGNSDEEIYQSTIAKTPKPLGEVNPNIPKELEQIINRALKKDTAERYQTANDLRLDLIALKENLSSKSAGIPPKNLSFFAQIAVWLILITLLGIGMWFFFLRAPADNAPINSIAVLSFQNSSVEADTEYLSDGLTESLIYRLSQFPNLKVSPTSSVFRYKGKETDPNTIAKELGVDAVMTGRIAQRGENLTISVELIDVKNNKTLWGEQYERKMSELLVVQREITAEIANNLKLKLSGGNEQNSAKKYTDSNQAHQLYLKGRFLYARRKKEDILEAIEDFRQALRLDPDFALAYVGIADCYNILPTYAYLPAKEAIPQAKSAARKALELDPALAEAHSALAFALSTGDLNWSEAERGYKRALELNPNIAEIHYRYGLDYLIPMGRTDEAISEIKRAAELEPLSLPTITGLSGAYMFAGQNDRAIEQAQKAFELEPNFVGARVWLGYIYANNGMYAKAFDFSQESLQVAPNNQAFLRLAGYSYAKLGNRAEAEKVIEKFRETAKTQYVASYYVATIYTALSDYDRAFAELEKSLAERDYLLLRLKVDPFMKPLRGDPRFASLIQRLGLPK